MKLLSSAALCALALAACATPPETPAAAAAAATPVVISYEATGLLAKSLPEIADALAAGEITSVALTKIRPEPLPDVEGLRGGPDGRSWKRVPRGRRRAFARASV